MVFAMFWRLHYKIEPKCSLVVVPYVVFVFQDYVEILEHFSLERVHNLISGDRGGW